MGSEQQILNLYKRAGETPLERLNRFRKAHKEYENIPMTYAGRLDPMAGGVLIVLAGETRFKREEFLLLPKEYEFECLWGISTDTYDSLGLIVDITGSFPEESEIKKITQGLIGKREQKYPLYSSKTVGGKSLFSIARDGEGEDIEIPKKEIEIFSLDILLSRTIRGGELLGSVVKTVGLVQGDFRQAETLALWKSTLEPHETEKFLITKMKARVSSGTYIRSLVHEMGEMLGTGALAYEIVRMSVGDYTIEDSLKD